MRMMQKLQEVVEHLVQFLNTKEVGVMCCVSKKWREALNIDHIWYKLCRKVGCHTEFGKFVTRPGIEDRSLQILCDWGYHFRLCQGVRRRWRTGGEEVIVTVFGNGGTQYAS